MLSADKTARLVKLQTSQATETALFVKLPDMLKLSVRRKKAKKHFNKQVDY